jgi:hypothetical protein
MNVEREDDPMRTCWICGNSVDLETCIIDQGLPVHPECHAKELRQKTQYEK